MSDTLDESLYEKALNTFQGCGNISISLIQMCLVIKFSTASSIIERMYEDGLLPCDGMSEEEQRQAEEKQHSLMRKAMRKRPRMLEFVPEQTPDLCLAAVESDGTALEFVREQTDEICSAALKSNPNAAQYIRKKPE